MVADFAKYEIKKSNHYIAHLYDKVLEKESVKFKNV